MELRPSVQKIPVAKGHAVVGRDFTGGNGNGRQYDRVPMNPQFEKGADMVLRLRRRPDGVMSELVIPLVPRPLSA